MAKIDKPGGFYPSIIVFVSIGILLNSCTARPVKTKHEPRQVNFQQRDDGTIVASFAASQGAGNNNFGIAQSYEFGPRGSSSSSSSSFNSDILGNKMSFANSQAQSQRIDPFGGGGGFSAANAAANSFSNPLFSSSNAQANAFGSQFG